MIVHLVTGNVGAGKTTYAIELAARVGGVRFTIDEWMVNLFHADLPSSPSLEWNLERLARIEKQIWAIVPQLRCDAILDIGLARRSERDLQRSKAAALGLQTQVHFLDIDLATRRARVKERNRSRTESFAYEITDEMIDFMETWYEPPGPDELTT